MSDTLEIFGREFTGVTGFKAKDNNGNTLTYTRGGSGGGTITIEEIPNATGTTLQITTNGSGGGGGSFEVYLGATPVTLTQDASITLKGSGSISYSYDATDKTFDDRENVTYQNATFTENSAYYEVTSNGGSAWYYRSMNMEFTGLTVGKSYTFTIVPYDTTLSEATGGYWALSDSNGTNITYINVLTSTATYTWTATTSTVKVMLLPTDSMYESLGKARFVSFTISSSETGTFSDEQVLGLLTSGTTITSSPSCGVYAVTGGSTPSATQHDIYFEFSDETNTTITAYWDDSFISDAITATTPTTYGNKTVTLAQLDGVTWYETGGGDIPLNTELVDYTAVSAGYYVNDDGTIAVGEAWDCVTDYITIEPSMTFSFISRPWTGVGFYDSNKTPIRCITSNDLGTVQDNYVHGTITPSTIPSNAVYCVLTGNSYSVASNTLSLIRTA